MGHGKPGKSWNFRISFPRPGKSWKLCLCPEKLWENILMKFIVQDIFNSCLFFYERESKNRKLMGHNSQNRSSLRFLKTIGQKRSRKRS